MPEEVEESMEVIISPASDWQDRLKHITETMRRMSRYTDPSEMVLDYTNRMGDYLHYDRMLSLTRRGVEPPSFIVARDNLRKQFIDPWKEREKLPVLRGGLLGSLIYGDEPRLIEDLQVDPSDPAAELLEGFRSLAAIPMYDRGELMNLVVFLQRAANAFDPHSLPQMVWTTNLFGRATHNLVITSQLKKALDALDREMKTIADIQRSLLPQELPKIPTLDLAAYYQPATHAGGDYYDFFPLPQNRWGVLIADVAGHGSPAAVLMAITHALAHTIAIPGPHECPDPATMLNYLNHHLARRYTGGTYRFVTAFFAVYDPATHKIAYTSAGHPAPRVKRCSDGGVFSLNAANSFPLGIDPDAKYTSARQTLERGDQVLFYTDGISEARSKAGELFGVERLDRSVESCRIDAAGLIAAVLHDVEAFSAGREPDDDRTLLIAKVTA
jgi:sigma-B regulation protein RsbU (phosphoserine phosphatase)